VSNITCEVAFDRALLTPEYLADPYPFYRELREKAPVYFSQRMNAWVLTRYQDVAAGLGDKRLICGRRVQSYTAELPHSLQQEMWPLFEHLEKWIDNMDPPDHTRLRGLVNKAFTPRMVEELAPTIEEVTDRLLDAVEPRGHMEFIHDFAYPLPATVIALMLGIPAGDQSRFIGWANDIAAYSGTGKADPLRTQAAQRSVSALKTYFRALAEGRRVHPQKDLISALVVLEEMGDRLAEEELFALCVFLLVAGHETTMALLANGLLALLRNPAQADTLQSNPGLVKTAVEEFLRYDSSIQHETRVAAEAVEYRGVRIEAGQRVVLMIGAANRDPAVFHDPDTLDIRREPNKHLAFGYGIHYCLGAPLARLEAQIAFRKVLGRFPRLRLKSDQLEWRQHTSHRNPVSMEVVW
jgi:pimeloyl-[acyl-carrier protein] synthase